MPHSTATEHLLRHQTRDFLLNYGRNQPDANGLTAILAHIENNLSTLWIANSYANWPA